MSITSVYHRNPNLPPPLAKAGRGVNIVPDETVSKRRVFDMSCGAGVTGLGHSCAIVKTAMQQQIYDLPYVHSAQFTSDPIERAAAMVIEECRVDFQRPERNPINPFEDGAVSFFSGGAEAIEAAFKMAMQYVACTTPSMRTVPVGRRHSYHGNTMFTLSLGDHPRKDVLKTTFNLEVHVERIEAYGPNLFAPGLNNIERQVHESVALKSLEQVLAMQTRFNRRCIVVIETIGGTTIGIAPPSLEYLIGIRQLCDAHRAVLIYDEILCANFRTGCMTAWQYYQGQAGLDIAPDIFVMGKGITAGYFPMSAVVVTKEIAHAGYSHGRVWHTSTNQNHPIGGAALCAAFMKYREAKPRIEVLSSYIKNVIAPYLRRQPGIMGMDGVGTLWGVRLDPNVQGLHKLVKSNLLTLGYGAYSDGDTVGGRGNMLLFAPPFTSTERDLDNCADAITSAVASVNRLIDPGEHGSPRADDVQSAPIAE